MLFLLNYKLKCTRSSDEITENDQEAMRAMEQFYYGQKSPQEVSKEKRNAALEEMFSDSNFR